MKNYMLYVVNFPDRLIRNVILNDDYSNLKSIIVNKEFIKENKELIYEFSKINFIVLENSVSFLSKELSNISFKDKIMIEKYIDNTNDLLNILLLSQRFCPDPLSINNALSNSLLGLQWATFILNKYQPNKIFFPISPHDLLGYSIYCVAKYKKIDIAIVKILTGINPKKGFIMSDIYDTDIPELRITGNDFSRNKDKINTSISIKNRIQACLESKYSLSSKKIIKKKISSNNLKVSFSALIYKLLFRFGFKRYFIFDLNKYELTIEQSFNLLKKFKNKNVLYMPLGFQPEVTSNPMSYPLFTVHSAISIIRSILPDNWILLVKDHPNMLTYNNLSYSNYRNEITGNIINNSENCFLINNKIKSLEILNISNAVLTGVGSVGIEALIKGIPVITYGNGPYISMPNVYKCSSYNSILNALLEIEKNKSNNADESLEIISYLDSLRPSNRAIDFQNKVGDENWETEYTSNLIDLINT